MVKISKCERLSIAGTLDDGREFSARVMTYGVIQITVGGVPAIATGEIDRMHYDQYGQILTGDDFDAVTKICKTVYNHGDIGAALRLFDLETVTRDEFPGRFEVTEDPDGEAWSVRNTGAHDYTLSYIIKVGEAFGSTPTIWED